MQKLMQRYVPAGCDEITRPGLPGIVYVDRARLCAQAYRVPLVPLKWVLAKLPGRKIQCCAPGDPAGSATMETYL